MNDTLAFLLVGTVWFALQFVVLPRMGVPT
jgi:hypothetical protein